MSRPFSISRGVWLGLLFGVTALTASAADGAPAVINKLNDKGQKSEVAGFPNAFVFVESVDGIEFVVDDARSPNRLSLKFRTYDVEYKDVSSADFIRAKTAEEAGTPDKAYEAYAKAAAGAKYAWVKEEALFRGATVALSAKKFDEAIALTATLEKDAPRSLLLARALMVRGQAQAAKGDPAAATKTFATVSGMNKNWGDAAAILGAQGQAGVLAANKQFSEAADVLAKVLSSMDVTKSKSEYVNAAIDLADYQHAAGKADAAVTTLQGVAYLDVEAKAQARAHLSWAKALAERSEAAGLAAAFDQAAIAATTKGADPATLAAAKALAATVADKLSKDPTVSATDKAEYKRTITLF